MRIPLRTYLEEASALAALMERHLEPLQEDGREYPGLSRVFDEQTLSWETPSEIRELVIVIGELQSRNRATEKRGGYAAVMAEARRLRSEWMAGLKFLFEQTDNEEGKRLLRHLRAQFKNQSLAGMIVSLQAVLCCVEKNMEELRRLGCSDDTLARTLAVFEELRGRPRELEQSVAERLEPSAHNQLLAQLDARVEAARRAFRFVFRGHEDVLGKAQSGYARARRRKHIEKKKQAQLEDGE